jgi:hypothetical protein
VALPRRAITVIPTVSITQAEAGPPIPKYRVHLDQGGFYRFAVGDVLTPDDVTVIGGTGGTGGNWLLVRDDDAGANLTDANATIQVGGKRWRTLPAATLTANRTLTLGTTNAAAGDWIEITRLDVEAYTLAIANGGAGAGTLITMPVSTRYWFRAYFNGTNWIPRAGGAFVS